MATNFTLVGHIMILHLPVIYSWKGSPFLPVKEKKKDKYILYTYAYCMLFNG